ncbi:MAG: aldo/keto reductase, partial [Bacteroidota bacterium]
MNPIALGTWAFASQIYGDVPAQDAHDTVRYALDHGVTTFDTAPLYGSKTEDGISERILADALGDALDRVTIS